MIWVAGLPVCCARGSQGDAEGKDSTPIPFVPCLSFLDTSPVQLPSTGSQGLNAMSCKEPAMGLGIHLETLGLSCEKMVTSFM